MASFYDPVRDGVTQGLLSRFKTCRQATRDSLAGWSSRYTAFPLVYGSLTHYVLEQAYARTIEKNVRRVPTTADVLAWMENARQLWHKENPVASDVSVAMFEESYMKNAAILPQYFRYWKSDFMTRAWEHLEREFKIPFQVTLPSGRVVDTFLRGKMDGVFRRPLARSRPKARRLFETKTRTHIDETQLVDTMPFNLQTSTYLLALSRLHGEIPAEVEMNLVRKTALRQGKAETSAAYEQRIAADVAGRPDWYFVRMSMSVDPSDVKRMEQEVTALVIDFLMWWYGESPHYRNDNACYAWNRACDMLGKCSRNDTTRLFKRDTVFTELEGV